MMWDGLGLWGRGEGRIKLRGGRDGLLDQGGCEDREEWIDLGAGVDKIAAEWIGRIWRPITATFYFPVGPGTGFLYLVNLYFLYQYSTRLETGAFDGRPADYLFMLLFNWICIVITGLAMDMQLLMIPLIMSVLYVWAQLNRDMIVSFWFGTRFKACYLPWVILGFNYIIGGSVINELIGNLVGHLYFFLMFRYPMDLGGRNFLSTPQFLYHWLPNRRGGVSGFGVPPANMRRAADQNGGGGRHNWGQGFRLGDQ
uniref:Derlin n=1 Tax=Equus caballus TaxID=9796 RepID=A0A9L0RG59_HORSE